MTAGPAAPILGCPERSRPPQLPWLWRSVGGGPVGEGRGEASCGWSGPSCWLPCSEPFCPLTPCPGQGGVFCSGFTCPPGGKGICWGHQKCQTLPGRVNVYKALIQEIQAASLRCLIHCRLLRLRRDSEAGRARGKSLAEQPNAGPRPALLRESPEHPSGHSWTGCSSLMGGGGWWSWRLSVHLRSEHVPL